MPDMLATERARHLLLGERGERMAAEYLEAAGYRLVAANFTIPVGRAIGGAMVHAELDLIAYDGSLLCFIEVKTRASDWYAAPEANVDLRKQRQVARAARAYRRLFNLAATTAYRFDVVSITIEPVEMEGQRRGPRIELLKNFWTDEKFRKRRWADAGY